MWETAIVTLTQVDKQYGYERNGEMVISAIYDYAGYFYEGLAEVSIDGKYGFINEEGNTVIPLEYDYADDFENGIAEVGICDFADIQEERREAKEVSAEEEVSEATKKYGYIDKTGKEVIPVEYDEIGEFSVGRVRAEKGDEWYIFDTKGNVVDSSDKSAIQKEEPSPIDDTAVNAMGIR